MKVSFEWLNNFFNGKLELNDLCEKLTISGTKVEMVESSKIQVTNVVTGLIEKISAHPDAEKLVVCSVNVGDKNVQIVTGAKNMVEGDIVPVALHGAVLAGGLKIKKGKLRGVESQGMMCSEEELGLVDKADGLMIMDKSTPVGANIADVLNKNDDVIEFEITSNRADCLGVLGIVREIKAIYGYDMNELNYNFNKNTSENITEYINVNVKTNKCRRFASRIIKNVKICESPEYIQKRLIGSGIKPINNIVDLTNYVMLEIGQPMHAYDYTKIKDKKIIVQESSFGESVITLDGVERELRDSVICIKDSEKILSLGGLMGGESSKVTEETKTIVLESANFKFDVIRNNSRNLNLRSESSLRFEKCIDDNLVLIALDRFCSLVIELNYGEIVDGTIDVVNETFKPVTINITTEYINSFLNLSLEEDKIKNIFENLGMNVSKVENTLNVKVPTFRRDVFIKEDLAEEIARIYGYDKIPSSDLTSVCENMGKTKKQLFYDKLINMMTSLGFSQSISYSFFNEKVLDKLNIEEDSELRNVINIKNPLGVEYSSMRTIMIPSMLEALCRNYSYSNDQVSIFEIGKTYSRNEKGMICENNTLVVGMYGKEYDYYSLKGVIEAIFSNLGISFLLERAKESFYHPGKSAKIILGKNTLGRFGAIHPYVLKNYNIATEFFLGEINIDKLFELYKWDRKYKAIPKYPSVSFDLNVVVNDEVLVQDIEKVIKSKAGNILESLEIFDVYKGPQIAENKKSISYNIIFRDKTKTLNDSEINKVINIILESLKSSFEAELRQ